LTIYSPFYDIMSGIVFDGQVNYYNNELTSGIITGGRSGQ
jgi:hypothetical protein